MSAAARTYIAGSKLTYFGLPGRGEASRLAFIVGGVDFEDERLGFPEWGGFKSSTPFGSLPILTLNTGDVITQQRSILRFIGKHVDLYPTDPLQAVRVDEVLDFCDDLAVKINNAGQGKDGDEKLEARANECNADGTVGKYLQYIDNFISKYGGNSGYCVGTTLTIADLIVFSMTGFATSGFYDGIPKTVLEAYPNIQAVRKTVSNHEAIKAYYLGRKDNASEDFLNNQRD
jgi:prostaglandin-H2 D-isomerase / glutathione transferase